MREQFRNQRPKSLHPPRLTAKRPTSVRADYSRGARWKLVSITYVGKESNLLEDVENEIVHDWDDVQQRYEDTRLDLLNTSISRQSGMCWRVVEHNRDRRMTNPVQLVARVKAWHPLPHRPR